MGLRGKKAEILVDEIGQVPNIFREDPSWTPPVSNLPMDDVGEEVVVLEPVVDADLLVVDRQRPRVDATLLQRQITI